jgi:hypothetical protein
MKISWVMAVCSLIAGYQRYKERCYHRHGRDNALKMQIYETCKILKFIS